MWPICDTDTQTCGEDIFKAFHNDILNQPEFCQIAVWTCQSSTEKCHSFVSYVIVTEFKVCQEWFLWTQSWGHNLTGFSSNLALSQPEKWINIFQYILYQWASFSNIFWSFFWNFFLRTLEDQRKKRSPPDSWTPENVFLRSRSAQLCSPNEDS